MRALSGSVGEHLEVEGRDNCISPDPENLKQRTHGALVMRLHFSLGFFFSSTAQSTLEPANLLETGARNEILTAPSFPGSVRRLSGEARKHNGATDECYVFRQP